MSTVPVWEEFMAPALRFLGDGQVHRAGAIRTGAADDLGITPEQREELIASGQPRYSNRAMWALSYLYRAGAVERPSRGMYRITEVGRSLLVSHPGGITEAGLRQVPGYISPYSPIATAHTPQRGMDEPESALDPSEQIANGVTRLEDNVAASLLKHLLGQEPVFFEQAVLDLLMAMGYGGTEGSATRTQLSNDGGIDGIIDQDALGLSRIYVQAKRHGPDSTIGRPDIQAFVGALHGAQANQGVFITTARFSAAARDYASAVSTRVVLIDGARLTALMIRYGVGVQVKRTVHIVEVDEDYFSTDVIV